MTFQQGVSGNPQGNRHRTRHLLNQEFMQALLLNFRHQGKKAIENPTGAVTMYRRYDKPALGPVGDSLDDFQ